METAEYCDLLIVRANESLYVVEAPNFQTELNDLIEFAPAFNLILGTVVDKMFVEKNGEVYRCIGCTQPIYQARRVYKVHWEAWEGNDEPCG